MAYSQQNIYPYWTFHEITMQDVLYKLQSSYLFCRNFEVCYHIIEKKKGPILIKDRKTIINKDFYFQGENGERGEVGADGTKGEKVKFRSRISFK